jgi:uncharacterized membrane protein YtjA (UPF0391 family)
MRRAVDTSVPESGGVRAFSDVPQAWHLNKEENEMLAWAITFLIIALIAAALGFGTLAGTAASFAKILFFVFLVLFIVSLIFGRGRPVA